MLVRTDSKLVVFDRKSDEQCHILKTELWMGSVAQREYESKRHLNTSAIELSWFRLHFVHEDRVKVKQ